MNSAVISGRTTSEIELRYTQSGTAVGTVTVAVDRDFQKDGKTETDFIPVVMWGKTAEFATTHIAKGNRMEVAGRIQVRSYEAKDGSKRYITEIVADKVKPIDWAEKPNTDGYADLQPIDDGDVPF